MFTMIGDVPETNLLLHRTTCLNRALERRCSSAAAVVVAAVVAFDSEGSVTIAVAAFATVAALRTCEGSVASVDSGCWQAALHQWQA